MRTGLCFAAMIALVACGSKKEPAGSSTGAGSAPPPPPPPPAAVTTAELFVNDQPVGKVDVAQVKDWPRLDTLVPASARRLGMWQVIYLKSSKAGTSELNKPFETYRDYVPALFPGEGGTISFGMFDPVELGRKGKPALRDDGITELRIKLSENSGRGENETGSGGGTDPTKLELQIITPKGTQTMTGTKLLEVPRESMPGGGGDAKGWPLLTVLDAAGVKPWKKLRLTDAAGLNLTMERKEIDASTIPFIKLNRQGALRFRVFKKQGEGFQASGDLRALTKIEILE